MLKGIYQHGMGSWDAISMDTSLKLGDKILLNGSKAQLKRVNTRAEYLLKVLKKQIDFKSGVVRSFRMSNFFITSTVITTMCYYGVIVHI